MLKTRRQTKRHLLKTINKDYAIVKSKETGCESTPFKKNSDLYATLINPSKIVCSAKYFDNLCESIIDGDINEINF